MATTLLSSVALSVGEQTNVVTIVESDEAVTLELVSTQVGSASSQARVVCLDALGHVKLTMLINGSGTEQKTVESIDSDLTCRVECSSGSCRVTLNQLEGSEKHGEGAGGVVTADLADGSVTNPKLGDLAVDTAELADDAVTTLKVLDANVTKAKLGPDALGLENVIADPGSGVPIVVTQSGSIAITTAAAETNSLPKPTFVGQEISFTLDVRAVGDRVITLDTDDLDQAGNNVFTLDTAGDSITLRGVQIAGLLVWRLVVNNGATLA